MYNETITFYSKNPPNKGVLTNFDVKHSEDNSICGDDLEVYLKIENNKIVDFSFSGETAIITTACASIFGESIIDMDINEVIEKKYDYIEELVGMPISPRRKQASVLGMLTTINAIYKYLGKDKLLDFDDLID
ncbi:MAG: iron-sulfur cluster assembly scaffold protein [Candidatus Gracilibacteria bacterium]|nr:iron-sulfur cluster assembly scaffold protein [Candidatus Gracilibacteria bacterium]